MTTETTEADMQPDAVRKVTDEDPGPSRADRFSALAQQHGALVTLLVAMVVA